MKQLPQISYRLNPKTRFQSVLERELFERNLLPIDVVRRKYTIGIADALIIAKQASGATYDDVAKWLGIHSTTLSTRIRNAT